MIDMQKLIDVCLAVVLIGFTLFVLAAGVAAVVSVIKWII